MKFFPQAAPIYRVARSQVMESETRGIASSMWNTPDSGTVLIAHPLQTLYFDIHQPNLLPMVLEHDMSAGGFGKFGVIAVFAFSNKFIDLL